MDANAKTIARIREGWRKQLMRPIADHQAASRHDRGAIGPTWVSRCTLSPPPEDDARQALFKVIEALQGDWTVDYQRPSVIDVPGEWLARRRDADVNTPEPSIPEHAKYRNLAAETQSNLTIFYVHAGGFTVGSPAMARPTTSRLVSLTSAKCFSVSYRLAPQHPFPAALLDVFVAYLALLCPAKDAWHSPIPAATVVLAGESCGLNLCMALVQVILRIQESSSSITFHGKELSPSELLPTGVAGISGFFDLTFSLPSNSANLENDILLFTDPYHSSERPIEAFWPSDPPRGDIYCETSALCHPLVSPVTAQSWRGLSSLWLVCGQERMSDETKAVAQQAHKDGVVVRFTEYQPMPHLFHVTLPQDTHSKLALENWAAACIDIQRGSLQAESLLVTAEMEEIALKSDSLVPLRHSDILSTTMRRRDERKPYIRSKPAKPSL